METKGTIWREKQTLETFTKWQQTCRKVVFAKVQLGTEKHLWVLQKGKTGTFLQ